MYECKKENIVKEGNVKCCNIHQIYQLDRIKKYKKLKETKTMHFSTVDECKTFVSWVNNNFVMDKYYFCCSGKGVMIDTYDVKDIVNLNINGM